MRHRHRPPRTHADRSATTAEETDRRGNRATPSAGDTKTTRDLNLIADFLKGDPTAVETVSLWLKQAAGRYRDRLPTEWQDLLQDLLLEVTTALLDDRFRHDSGLRTFAWRIAHYRCLNKIRDLARRPESELGDSELRIPDPTRPVLERLLETESEDQLLRFLDEVPSECRRLWKSILAGRSFREISHETGISEGALRVRVLRCRQKALVLWRTWLES